MKKIGAAVLSYINYIVFHTFKYYYEFFLIKKIKICLKNALSTRQINDERHDLFSFLAHFVNFLVRGLKTRDVAKFYSGQSLRIVFMVGDIYESYVIYLLYFRIVLLKLIKVVVKK